MLQMCFAIRSDILPCHAISTCSQEALGYLLPHCTFRNEKLMEVNEAPTGWMFFRQKMQTSPPRFNQKNQNPYP